MMLLTVIINVDNSVFTLKFCVFQVLCVLGFGFGSYIVWFSILVLSFGSQFWFLVWFLVLLSVLVLSLVLGFGS